jgi:hypothetical protein
VTVAQLLDSVTADFAVLARRLRDETGALRRFVNIYVDGDEVRRLHGLDTEVAPDQAPETAVRNARPRMRRAVLTDYTLRRGLALRLPGAWFRRPAKRCIRPY